MKDSLQAALGDDANEGSVPSEGVLVASEVKEDDADYADTLCRALERIYKMTANSRRHQVSILQTTATYRGRCCEQQQRYRKPESWAGADPGMARTRAESRQLLPLDKQSCM